METKFEHVYALGDAEPVPEVKLHAPGWHWHIGKVWFEKNWLWRWLTQE